MRIIFFVLVGRSCGYPGSPDKGSFSGSVYSYGKKVTYSCQHGYRMVGESERMCLNSGRWTGDVPQCQGNF